MKTNQNPLSKQSISQNNNFSLAFQSINLSDMPDFIYPEKDQKISELYTYLTQNINWPFYSLEDIYSKQPDKNNLTFLEWQKKIESFDKEKKNNIINNLNKSTKFLIDSVIEYMKFLNFYFFKFEEKIRTFIFLEYFLKKLESDNDIINSDEYAKLYKFYFNLCRDTINIFDYLDKNKILIKNELFYYEKGCYYERIHKYKEANETYVEGFINVLDDNDSQAGKILLNNYINFENRMINRIARDLETLDEDWESIDAYIHKKINEYKERDITTKNLNNSKKIFINNNREESIEEKIIKGINCNFSIKEGRLNLLENRNSNGTEVVGVYGNVKFIKNPPDINKVSSITYIYEILKMTLSLFYSDWKREYDNFDLEVQQNCNKLPYSWISNLRPTKRNIKNMQENNMVLNLIQKEYMTGGNWNSNNSQISNQNEVQINNNINLNNNFNEEINVKEEEEENNEHEISNMLNSFFGEKEEKINKNIDINNKIFENNIQQNKVIDKDTNTILENIQFQMEHPPKNTNEYSLNNNNRENIAKQPKKKKIKKNKFKCVGTLNFDQDGLILVNLAGENDQKIELMQSASKLLHLNDGDEKNEDKKPNKKYIITLDNAPRRIKYIKEKALKEKKLYEQKRKEMLQGINFDYLNSFKKLFETYPELNNLLENEPIINQKKKIEEYKLDLKNDNNNNNINTIGETNIQRSDGPSKAMKLLLEVYGISSDILEENNSLNENSQKKELSNTNSMFENLFNDIKSYINRQNLDKKKNLFSSNKNSKDEKNEIKKEVKENVDDDGDLIIESESEEENNNYINNVEQDKNKNNENNNESKKSKDKESKHCKFDSKKNSEFVYYKNEQNEIEDRDGFGKIIDDINKKAEKGIKIGEKTIFSNYKGIREHSFNKKSNNKNDENEEKFKIENNNKNIINDNIKNNNLVVNNSIEISINNEKKKNEEEIESDRNLLITNSKLSTDIFMNALNFNNNNDNRNNNINNKRNNSKRKRSKKQIASSVKEMGNALSSSLSSDNFENNYYSEAINFSKSKREKEFKTINLNVEQNVNNFKFKNEKQLSNIKENASFEKEKSSNIKRNKKDTENIEVDVDLDKSINKKYNSNIGDIHDLDNFDDLFK